MTPAPLLFWRACSTILDRMPSCELSYSVRLTVILLLSAIFCVPFTIADPLQGSCSHDEPQPIGIDFGDELMWDFLCFNSTNQVAWPRLGLLLMHMRQIISPFWLMSSPMSPSFIYISCLCFACSGTTETSLWSLSNKRLLQMACSNPLLHFASNILRNIPCPSWTNIQKCWGKAHRQCNICQIVFSLQDPPSTDSSRNRRMS